MSVVRNLLIRAGADFSQAQKGMRNMSKQMSGFKQQTSVQLTAINKSFSGLAARLGAITATVTATVAGFSALAAGTAAGSQEAIRYESALTRLNMQLGEGADEFMRWGQAQGLARQTIAEMGATFATLVSSFTDGQSRITESTRQLFHAVRVTAGATGRSYDDVTERFRSGLLGNTEAIEDLGVFVNVAMIESTDAFRRLAGDKSWDQIDFNIQQQIRLAAILEQVYKRYGDTVQNTVAIRQSLLIEQLKEIKLNLSQAVLPIYNAVLPALQIMAQSIATVTSAIAQFVNAFFGFKSVADSTTGIQEQAGAVSDLGDSYEKAGKQAKRGLASFDEINQLSESSGADGAVGAVGEADTTGPMDQAGAKFIEVSKQIEEAAGKVKEFFKELAEDPNIKKVVEAYGEFKRSLSTLGEAIEEFINSQPVQDFLKNFGKKLAESFLNARLSDLKVASGVFESWAGFFEILTGIVTLDFGKVAEGFRQWASGLGKTIEGFIQVFSPSMAEKFAAFRTRIGEIWDEITNIKWSDIESKLFTAWGNIKKTAETKWVEIRDAVKTAWGTFTQAGFITWSSVSDKVSAWWEFIKNAVPAAWANIRNAVRDAWATFTQPGNIAWSAVSDKLSAWWLEIKNAVPAAWEKIRTAVSDAWGEFTDGVSIEWESVSGKVAEIWGAIERSTSTVWDGIVETVKGSVNVIIDAINSFLDAVSDIKFKLPEFKNPITGKKIGGGTVGMPDLSEFKLPRLARGGIVDSPTVAMIGEDGSEAVVPLENTAFVDKLASALGTAVLTAMQTSLSNKDNRDGNITLQVDGRTFARIINPYLASEQQRIGPGVIIQPT